MCRLSVGREEDGRFGCVSPGRSRVSCVLNLLQTTVQAVAHFPPVLPPYLRLQEPLADACERGKLEPALRLFPSLVTGVPPTWSHLPSASARAFPLVTGESNCYEWGARVHEWGPPERRFQAPANSVGVSRMEGWLKMPDYVRQRGAGPGGADCVRQRGAVPGGACDGWWREP